MTAAGAILLEATRLGSIRAPCLLHSKLGRTPQLHEMVLERATSPGRCRDASYTAVPHLVRIHRKHAVLDWNTYAIVAVIELARTKGKNPEPPPWLKEDYFRAIEELTAIGAGEISRTKEPEAVRASHAREISHRVFRGRAVGYRISRATLVSPERRKNLISATG
jgi:hypothetical protein